MQTECNNHSHLVRSTFDAVIVGAGATSVAVLSGLEQKGVTRVLVLDSGSHNQTAATPEIANVNGRSNLGMKSWLGSFAAYGTSGFKPDYLRNGVYAQPSRYLGGFTRVWGATVDFQDTTMGLEEGLAITPGDIELVLGILRPSMTSFEDEGNSPGRVVGSKASGKIFKKLLAVKASSWRLKPSNLAIDTAGGSYSCQLRGTCIEGCSLESIWFARNEILNNHKNIQLETGKLVTSLGEINGVPYVEARCLDCMNLFRVSSKRVFVASGPIATGIILMNSGVISELELSDTATAFGVGFSLRWSKFEKGHNLSQFWITDILDKNISAQVYPPSRVFAGRIADRLPRGFLFKWLALTLSHFVHPVIFYNKSGDSAKLKLSKTDDQIQISGQANEKYNKIFMKRIAGLGRFLWKAGLIVPLPLVQLTPPGTGYHSGSSIPMGEKTDALGRVLNFESVHFVDSSVLPEIQVGSLTPTVMANAARIVRLIYS